MTEILIKDTFDTARLVAYYRAMESERSGALFHDPYARLLAGERGEELARTYTCSTQEVWGTAMRTRVYDEIVLHVVEQGQIDTVINLAAGLDSRPYRLSLPASLHWIEVDFAPVLQYKEELLASAVPACKLERMALDITKSEELRSFLADISEESKQMLILTEGLLVYLEAEQVVELANVLHEQEAVHLWLTEFITHLPPGKVRREWKSIAAESVQERFATPRGAAFFAEYGWEVSEFHSAISTIVRLRIPIRLLWFFTFMRILKLLLPDTDTRQSGFVLLKRASVESSEAVDLPSEKRSEQEGQEGNESHPFSS